MDESCTLLSEGNISSITNSKNEDPSVVLSNLKNNNNDRLVIGHININALRNKFEILVSLVKDKLDIVLISESKIDDTFPKNQFLIEGYSTPFRSERNSHGGGLILYLREDTLARHLILSILAILANGHSFAKLKLRIILISHIFPLA